jgi:hypothetical protein
LASQASLLASVEEVAISTRVETCGGSSALQVTASLTDVCLSQASVALVTLFGAPVVVSPVDDRTQRVALVLDVQGTPSWIPIH